MSIKERVKGGLITLDEAQAEIARGNRGLKRSKSARWVNKQKKQMKPRKKRVDAPVEVKQEKKSIKPLTLKECVKVREEFEPVLSMTPEKHKTLMGHMNQWIGHLRKKKH